MFGLGTWEILLILVAALVFIGPDQLPKVAKTIGKGMRQVRDAMSDVDQQVRRASHELMEQAAAEDDDEDPGEIDDPPDEAAQAAPPDGKAEAAPPPAPPGAPTEDAAATAPSTPQDAEGWHARLKRPVDGRVAAAPPKRRRSALRPASSAATDATHATEGRQTAEPQGDEPK